MFEQDYTNFNEKMASF